MTNLDYIYAAAATAIIVIVFILFSRKKEVQPEQEQIDLSEPPIWTEEETAIINRINEYRNSQEPSLLPLVSSDELKVLSQGRVKWWLSHDTPKENLHDFFPGHARIYHDKGFEHIDELAQAGYVRIFYMYKSSPTHNESMLNPDFVTAAITIRKNELDKNRTCLLIGK